MISLKRKIAKKKVLDQRNAFPSRGKRFSIKDGVMKMASQQLKE